MKKILITIFILSMTSCTKEVRINNFDNSRLVKKEKNIARLISFTENISSDNQEYKVFYSKLKRPVKIEAEYKEENIVVTTYTLGNECLQTKGDIEIKKDSIILVTDEIISGDICEGIEIKKLVFTIKNPEKKEFKFGYRGVSYHYRLNY